MNIKDKLEQLDRLSELIAYNEREIANFKNCLSDNDPMSATNLFNYKQKYTHKLEIALKVRTRFQERWVRAVREIEKHYDNLEL